VAIVVGIAAALIVGLAGTARAELIAHWAFDEGTGASTAFSSTGYYDGTVDTTSAYKPTTGVSGKIGNAYLFGGASGIAAGLGGVTVNSTSILNDWTNATLSSWYYVDSFSAYRRIFNKITVGTTTAKNEFGFGDPSYNYWMVKRNNSYRVTAKGAFDAGTQTGTWVQLTGTFEPGTAKIYVNGILAGSETNANVAKIYATTGKLYLGTMDETSTNVWNGKLDDLGILNETLSQPKVRSIYCTPNVAGLGDYNLAYMYKLFGVYDDTSHTKTETIGTLTWEYMASSTGDHDPSNALVSSAWTDGSHYYVRFGTGADTSGVMAAIPEPSTLALLACGLVGLLAYAWRKRK
jgi:hypothetical protein